jgi:hypothetical protein
MWVFSDEAFCYTKKVVNNKIDTGIEAQIKRLILLLPHFIKVLPHLKPL